MMNETWYNILHEGLGLLLVELLSTKQALSDKSLMVVSKGSSNAIILLFQ